MTKRTGPLEGTTHLHELLSPSPSVRPFLSFKGANNTSFSISDSSPTVVAGKSWLWVFNPINPLSTQLKPKTQKTKS
jgi:hypothetical protein